MVDLLLGAVGQKQQQPWEVSLRHCRQQPSRHGALWRRSAWIQLEWRHKRPLFVLGADPRLPLFTVTHTHTYYVKRLL